jgi:hypothetical protein
MPLLRSRTLHSPGGMTRYTPVLIPSPRTRDLAYLLLSDDGSAQSLASVVLDWLPGTITESLLVSASDRTLSTRIGQQSGELLFAIALEGGHHEHRPP